MQLNENHKKELEQLIEDYMEAYQGQGLVISLVNKKGESIYRRYFGWRNVEKQLPITPDTIFGMASITKSFTALAIMQLVEKGILDLYAPLNRYLPEFVYPNAQMPKLWHLLAHTAGYPPQPRLRITEIAPGMDMPEEEREDYAYSQAIADEGRRLLVDRLGKVERFLGQPGEYLSYSNDGYALMSEIIRQYGGEDSYASYVEKHILQPLGMTRSTYSFKIPKEDDNATVLYQPLKDELRVTNDWLNNHFMMMGGGSIKSTLSDMERYLAFWLNHGDVGQERIISSRSLRAMQKARMPYGHLVNYCFGLQTFNLDDIIVAGHGGSLTGVATNMLWSHDLGLGVVVLSNTSGMPVAAITKAAMKMANNHSPLEPFIDFKDCPWPLEEKEKAQGTFVSGEGSTFVISLKEENLYINVAGEDFKLRTVLPSLALAPVKMVPSEVRFYKNDQDEVWAIGYGGRMILRKE